MFWPFENLFGNNEEVSIEDPKSKLEYFDRQKISKRLTQCGWKPPVCCSADKKTYSIAIVELSSYKFGLPIYPSVFPMVQVQCNDCGQVSLNNAIILGIVDPHTGNIKNEYK